MSDMSDEIKTRELNEYQMRHVCILSHLLRCDAVDDQIIEYLHQCEIDYFTLLEKVRILESRVNIDEKTSLLKYSKSYLSAIVKTASRVYHGMEGVDYTVSLVRFDIDDFSRFNNKYGHDVGDEVLLRIAQTIRDASRPTDYVIRFGGEEIDVILPATSQQGAAIYVSKLLQLIRDIKIEKGGETLSVTVSAGISYRVIDIGNSLIIHDVEMEQIYADIQREADDALYESKSLGKDMLSVYDFRKKEAYREYRDKYEKLK